MSSKSQIKQKQRDDDWIDRSILETRREQRELGSVVTAEADSKNVALPSQLSMWSVADTIQWLECKQLHKFIFLFQKHRVTGVDLQKLNLPFLENYEHISVEEREVLLAEVYNLLHPQTVHASEEDLTKIRTPLDKKKYYAAIELAQVRSATLPRSSSATAIPADQEPSCSKSVSSSPGVKPRHKSESGVDTRSDVRSKLSKLENYFTDTKKRKTVPKSPLVGPRPVYDYLKDLGPQCISCLELSPQQHSSVTMATDGDGHVTVSSVPESLSDRLHCGDRVIEINGHLVRPQLHDAKTHIAAMLNFRSPATLVIVSGSNVGRGTSDAKWNQLHSLLVEMRDSDTAGLTDDLPISPGPVVSPGPIVSPGIVVGSRSTVAGSRSAVSPTDDQLMKHNLELQEEIRELQEKLRDRHKHAEKLQVDLEDKDAMMHDLQLSRDKAIEKLKQTRTKVRQKSSRESVGGEEYYKMAMNSINVDGSSKSEVVESLREVITEASKQKWYLDRLISLVIEESPWLLDEVDSEFDTLTLTDESEEFC